MMSRLPASIRRIVLVTRRLLRQNRILLLLLQLWPCVLTAILLISAQGHPQSDDAGAILEQELYYGLALVGLGASVALGTEQRAHRAQQVLGRAVSRGEYLLALGAAAYLPFAGYVLVWLANAAVLAGLLHLAVPALLPALVAELAAGLLLCGFGLLWSVLAPQMLAAVLSGAVLALLLAAGTHGYGGVATLFGMIAGASQMGAVAPLWRDAAEACAASFVLAAAAIFLFTRKDLRLS